MLTNAPLPMKDAMDLERSLGAETGSYFVELGRNRIRALTTLQKKWLQRKCNKRNPKCTWIQERICKFYEQQEAAYEREFGVPLSHVLKEADVRRKKQTTAMPTTAVPIEDD